MNALAIVRAYSPNGTPTTVVSCFNHESIVNAVARVNPADRVKIQSAHEQPVEYASNETAYGRTVGYDFAIKVF